MIEMLVKLGLPAALILMMIGVGQSLSVKDFVSVFEKPKAFIIGAIAQLLLLPLVVILVIWLFDLSNEFAIGMFLLALCPGGSTSNLYTFLTRGDLGLSVSLTALIGCITPITIPILGSFAILYYSDSNEVFELPLVKTWIQLMVITVIPVVAGMIIRMKWNAFAIKLEPFFRKFSILILVVVMAGIAFGLSDKIVSYIIITGPAALTLNILAMFLSYALAHFLLRNEAQSRTICFEVGLQNGTLALLITTSILQSEEMSIAPSIYSLVMFVTSSLVASYFMKRRNVDIKHVQTN